MRDTQTPASPAERSGDDHEGAASDGEELGRRWTISKWPDGQAFVSGPVIEPEEDGLVGIDWVNAARAEVVELAPALELLGAVRDLAARRLAVIEAEIAYLELVPTDRNLASAERLRAGLAEAGDLAEFDALVNECGAGRRGR